MYFGEQTTNAVGFHLCWKTWVVWANLINFQNFPNRLIPIVAPDNTRLSAPEGAIETTWQTDIANTVLVPNASNKTLNYAFRLNRVDLPRDCLVLGFSKVVSSIAHGVALSIVFIQ